MPALHAGREGLLVQLCMDMHQRQADAEHETIWIAVQIISLQVR